MWYHLEVDPSFRYDSHLPVINLGSLFILAEQIFTRRKTDVFPSGTSYEHTKLESCDVLSH